MSRQLWLPNNNDAYSAAGLGPNRLTLRTNWGQIAPVERDLRIFRAGAFAFWEWIACAAHRGFRGHELTEIRSIVMENGKLFLERWHEYFGGTQ